jgi:hypothetical protein
MIDLDCTMQCIMMNHDAMQPEGVELQKMRFAREGASWFPKEKERY